MHVHDPLCPWREDLWRRGLGVCRCELIATTRADEREKAAQAIEVMDSGWVAFQRLPQNTSHVAFVHENGEVYDPERGWGSDADLLLADARNAARPLVERDKAAQIIRDMGR